MEVFVGLNPADINITSAPKRMRCPVEDYIDSLNNF